MNHGFEYFNYLPVDWVSMDITISNSWIPISKFYSCIYPPYEKISQVFFSWWIPNEWRTK